MSTQIAAPPKRNVWRLLGIAGIVVVVLLAIGVGAFAFWGYNALPPMPEALAAMESNDQVTVTSGNWIEFAPAAGKPTKGFIFYPGARVDPRAYAPAMQALAAKGYLAVITPMPLNFAILATDKANAVIAAHPEITSWTVGGHSLGGASAAIYVSQHPAAVDGLVLWAAYPPDANSLAKLSDLVVYSISGTNDGLATPEKIDASRPLLPVSTTFVPIQGGNHAQFGWYGAQSGDLPATISREEQQRQVIEATAAALAAAP